jgi:hypothetical protein
MHKPGAVDTDAGGRDAIGVSPSGCKRDEATFGGGHLKSDNLPGQQFGRKDHERTARYHIAHEQEDNGTGSSGVSPM